MIVVSVAVLTMLIVGCVTVQDIPDVEATVVVMLEEEKAKSLPTPLSTEARLQEIKAKTFPTITPLPQPTPKPLSSVEILRKAGQVMADLESMSYKVEVDSKMFFIGQLDDVEMLQSFEGDFHVPDNIKQTLYMTLLDVDFMGQMFQVDGRYYEQEAYEPGGVEGEWSEIDGINSTGLILDPRDFWEGDESYLSFPDDEVLNIENLNGNEVYKIS